MMLASWGTQCDSQFFSHFEPFFFALLTPVYPKNQNFQYNASSYYRFTHIFWKLWSYNAWLSFWAFFTSHPFLTTQKIIILKNKTPGDIIILHMCTINDNHMIWYMVPEIRSLTDRIFCHFGLLFFVFLFPLLTNQKTKVLTKWKQTL